MSVNAISGLGTKCKSCPRYPSRNPYPRDRVVYTKPILKQSISLEGKYQNICFRNLVVEKCNFESYIEPNETYPIDAAPHCTDLEEGIAVAAGTERVFFLLGLLDPTKCKGMMSRDINPDVKRYIDFNVLLLRLSPTREIYAKLSDKPLNDQAFGQRIRCIADMLKNSRLPDVAKQYYETHLYAYAPIYLNAGKQWRNEDSFDGCNYCKCDTLFYKIKSYADGGGIFAVTGPINGLDPFISDRISVIDTSNILEYSFLKLKVKGNPRVIWTCPVRGSWQYRSYTHEPLSDKESLEFDTILDSIKNCTKVVKRDDFSDPYASHLLKITKACLENLDEASLGPIYSSKTLEFLRKYKENNILAVPG